MNLYAFLNDRSQAIGFATVPGDGTPLAVLAALPKGHTVLNADDDEVVLAAIGDGPLPPSISITKPAKRERDPERTGRKRTRRDRRARRARELPR